MVIFLHTFRTTKSSPVVYACLARLCRKSHRVSCPWDEGNIYKNKKKSRKSPVGSYLPQRV